MGKVEFGVRKALQEERIAFYNEQLVPSVVTDEIYASGDDLAIPLLQY